MTDTPPTASDAPGAEPIKASRTDGLKKFRGKPKNRIRTLFLVLGGLFVAGLLWFGITTVTAFNKISTKSDTASPLLKFFGETVDPNALKGEGDGRINILFIGVGGSSHKGGTLADTIMVASVDPENKQLALLSIPRDLRVPIAGNGQGKINSAHSYGETQEKGTGPIVLKETVSTVLDLPIHYYVRADFDGFTKFIDKIGGVDVDVERAINDPLYPDEQLEGYDPFSIAAGPQHLSGKTALKYARSRESTSDFDRARRQQQILLAVREKVLTLGVIGNPKKVSEIMGILGEHVRMDLTLAEIERLANIVKDVDTDSMVTKVLDNSADGPLKSISEGGYYLVPKAGNFRDVQRIAHELFTDPYIRKEKARIEILNGTGQAGLAKELELDLKSLGYTIVSVDTTETTSETLLYDYSAGTAPFTVRYLADRVNGPVRVADRPTDAAEVDLRLILGQDYTETIVSNTTTTSTP